MNTRWDVVLYLASEHFLYYLPAILRAAVEYPRGQLARALTAGQFRCETCEFSVVELSAVEAVQEYLASKGVTLESEQSAIHRGKVQAKLWREHGQTLAEP